LSEDWFDLPIRRMAACFLPDRIDLRLFIHPTENL
jgi:hypothetical protein